MKRRNDRTYTTTRNTYKSVKKYDHTQFDEFCTRVYLEGYRDGAESVPGIDEAEIQKTVQKQLQESRTEILARISTIKGIGTAKLERIGEAMRELFGDTEEKEETAE